MAERKYYWIKLKKDFMNSDAVDFLMSQKNGAEYVVLYQMLCLMTVKTNGKLERQLNEVIIPYDAEKIQRDTKYFNIDTVRNALQLYIHLGLIYKDDNGCLSIADYENLVGVESGSAERMRRLRNLKASQCDELSDANVTKLLQKSDELSDTDIDIDKEIDIDLDKNPIEIIVEEYQSRIAMLDGTQFEILKEFVTLDGMEAKVVLRAIGLAADNGKRNFSYIKAILTNWKNDGVLTIAAVEERERAFKESKNKGSNNQPNKKSNVPEWSNPDYVNTTSEETKEELERRKKELLNRLEKGDN